MSWKNWPGWLKGGIVGLVIGIIYLIIIFVIAELYCVIPEGLSANLISFCKILEFLLFPFKFLSVFAFGNPTIIIPIINLIIFPILGAIIGFIISKIKKRKQIQNAK